MTLRTQAGERERERKIAMRFSAFLRCFNWDFFRGDIAPRAVGRILCTIV